MRFTLAAILLVTAIPPAIAEANQPFTVVLHARIPSGTGSCDEGDLPNCHTGSHPRTILDPGTDFRLYVAINGYFELSAFRTAFAWPTDWSVDPDGEPPVVLNCQGNQVNALVPSNPGGPIDGIYATAFDCVRGPALCFIARIDFHAGLDGCLFQVNPVDGSQRVEVIDCLNQSTFLDADSQGGQMNLGSICVNSAGLDACDPSRPVEPATWGRIKASYR